MSFPAYPEYKDSGVEWLDEVPAHWIESKVKYALIRVVAGGTPESGKSEYWSDVGNGTPWVAISDMTKGSLVNSTEKEISQLGLKSKGLEVLPKGSLIYSIYASLGKVATLGVDAVTNQAILGLVVNSHISDVGFLRWWMVSVERWIKAYSSSNTQENLNAEKVGNLPVLFPSIYEQRVIATFLDHETARIDALIAEQQRLIALLKEKRQALISHAVTKGLDPDAPMKDSGVEWLGDVPAHWGVASLKRYWSVADCKHITADFIDEGIPLASIREVQSRYVELAEAKQTTPEFYRQLISEGRKPVDGDLIISRNATVGEVAEVASWHQDFGMGQDVCLMRKVNKSWRSQVPSATLLKGARTGDGFLEHLGVNFQRRSPVQCLARPGVQ